MKELIIRHIPADAGRAARVSVGYRPRDGAQLTLREADFTFALTDDDHALIQWYLEEYLQFPWASHRAHEAEELMTAKGRELFQAVFGDAETFQLFANVANDLGSTRIVIQADDPAGISIPWELMTDPQRVPYGDLARLAYAFVRGQPDLIFDTPEPAVGSTVNILLVISRPGGASDVPFQSVARPLLERCAAHVDRVHIDVLRPPTFDQLARVLSEKPNFYQVLHFDGHGGFPKQRHGGGGAMPLLYGDSAAQGRLLFEKEDGSERPVTGEELGGLLAGKGVPMVVLNTCQSGMTHAEAVYPSVGNQLLKAGVSGVVAMAYSVYVQSAVRFVARLYEGLVNGEDLARAVALGREQLRVEPKRRSAIGEIDLHDWMVPILLEASPVRLVEKSAQAIRLTDPAEKRPAGAEVDCPPPPDYGFIGRDEVILTLERAFQRETVVLLQGMAGIGKTEAAVGFARWLAATGALEGPVLFSSFERRLTLGHVCDQVGRLFGDAIRAQLGREWHLLTFAERRVMALDILKQVPCLMIWDNFEPVNGFPSGTPSDWTEDEQSELRYFLSDLRGGKTKALVTSRRDEPWLGKIYRRVEVRGLQLPEAQELAVRVLERAGLKPLQLKKLPDYNRLLEYLDGSPLAIQVVLPELGRRKPDDLLRDLQVGEAKLHADDPALGRTRSLASSLTYRLDALDPDLRQRLGVLALFQGFVSTLVLANISGQDGVPSLLARLDLDDWVRELDKAAEVGLLRSLGGGFYTVHPAVPWFFHDALQETFTEGREWLETAYASVYASYSQQLRQAYLGSNAQTALGLFTAEESNLAHALRIAYRLTLWRAAELLLNGQLPFLDRQVRWPEIERMAAEGERVAVDSGGQPLSGREGVWIGLMMLREAVARWQRDFVAQENILMRLMDHFKERGPETNLGSALHRLGIVAHKRRRFADANNRYRQSLAVAERVGDKYGQATTLHQLGLLAQDCGQLDEAENCYQLSLGISERQGLDHGQASTLHQMGKVDQERGRLDEAENWYVKSLGINKRLRDEGGQAATLHQLGILAQRRGRLGESEEWYRGSLEIAQRLGEQQIQASALHQLGALAQELGRLPEAADWCHRGLVIFERLGDEYHTALSALALGQLAEQRGDAACAAEYYKQAEAIFARLDDPYSLQIVRDALQRVRPQPPPPAIGE